MHPRVRSGRFELTTVAHTGDRFRDFAPYVPAIDRTGTVAFQAALRRGGTGVFLGSGADETCVAVVESDSDGAEEYCSHPDIDSADRVSVYVAHKAGRQRVVRLGCARSWTIADTTTGPFTRIGPLGPTANDAGAVAFRADTASGPGIFVGDGGPPMTIADSRRFRAFYGLPVVNRHGAVVFRGDAHDGVQGVYLCAGASDRLETLVDSRRGFTDLGAFPCIDDAGAVTFVATKDGHMGLFKVQGGRIETIVDTRGPFASVRGGLLNASGTLVFFATPRGGALGVYAGPDPATDKIVGIGDRAFGSTIVDLALNPVSLNELGQIAIRLAFADGGQRVVRAELGKSV